MPTGRVLRSVLYNFLGTFTSRYSDYGGYWLFGQLVNDLDGVELDLLSRAKKSGDLLDSAHDLAVREFDDQLRKSGLDASRVTDARLRVDRMSTARSGERSGWNYRFHASATGDTGRTFECETVIFVAPHDPSYEGRSARAPRFRLGRPRVQGQLDM